MVKALDCYGVRNADAIQWGLPAQVRILPTTIESRFLFFSQHSCLKATAFFFRFRVFFAQTDCPLQRYFCSSRTLPAQQLSWQRLNERMGEPLAVQERRNQLYGPQRLAPGERARTLLQADNVLRKGELYDSGGAWKTTTGDFFKVMQSKLAFFRGDRCPTSCRSLQ